MQGKILVIILASILGLISVTNLSHTWYTSRIENEAKFLSKGDIVKEKEELEKLSSDTLDLFFTKYSYKISKQKALGLGLDLLGGMNVVLQISVKDLLINLADGGDSEFFQELIKRTAVEQKQSSDSYVNDFFKQYYVLKKERNLEVNLSSSQLFGNKKNSDMFDFTSTDQEVEDKIRNLIESKISVANKIIRQRIDRFGVSQPNVQRIEGSARILVELPGIKDTERVKELLVSTAQLEFWEVLQPTNGIQAYLESIMGRSKIDSTAINPISKMIASPQGFAFPVSDTAIVGESIREASLGNKKPSFLRNTKFLWASKTFDSNDSDYIILYTVKGKPNGQSLLSGDIVEGASARRLTAIGNQPYVSLDMKSNASVEWANITDKFSGKLGQPGSPIAIVLDDIVYSAPTPSEKIVGGSSQITGDFSMEEATDLANILAAGSLPASAEIIQSDVVGPTLGKEAIQSGLSSFAIALGIVLLWMIFYYGGAGIYSDITLLLNLLFLFGILVSDVFGAVLTLPGIAGIVLTIGMAVDANVIVYERVKEELLLGKSVGTAVKDGYANAMSSILDANVTTLATALILFVFGEGPVKGFATTLMIGIVTSLFCAILLTRVFIEYRLNNKGKGVTFYTSITKNWLQNIQVEFLGKRKIALLISAALITVSLGSIFTKGLDWGIDFVGGRNYTIRFEQNVLASDISSKLNKVLDNPMIKTFGNDNQIKISTKFKIDEQGEQVEKEIKQILFTNLKSYLPVGLNYEDFTNTTEDSSVGILSSSKVGPSIADDIKSNSAIAIMLALFVVFVYILVRFSKWQFSLGAVVAVFHDAIITLGIFSIFSGIMPFSMEIDQAFIAAILTVIGYSLNDTVIVFDRIRENMNTMKSKSLYDLINMAINSTLGRTINTSLTTLFVILIIFLFGGETIRGFMFALLVGILVGTYSSLFIATPIFYGLSTEKKAKTKV